MPTRKRSQGDNTGTLEIVTSEPVLVGKGRFSGKYKKLVFEAVDFVGTRYRIGDHVSMYAQSGAEWVCVIETLYMGDKNQPMFRGRWFWSVNDCNEISKHLVEPMRESKCELHELIACDNRDSNPVESISRKCYILNYDNFMLIKKTLSKPEFAAEKVFFCERQFYHKVFRFSEMNALLFPGDSIPKNLRKAAGLPDLQEPSSETAPVILDNAYYETDVAPKSKRKSPSVSSDPILIW